MEKEHNVETLRGVAIILMVLGHVIGGNPEVGLKVSETSGLAYLSYIFSYMRMPLFTVISGYIYAIKPISSSYKSSIFVNRKFSRLIVPFFISATLLFIMQIMIPGTNAKYTWSDFSSIFFYKYVHYWFCQALFFVFIIILIFEKLKLLNSFKNWLFMSIAISIFYLLDVVQSDFLSLYKWPFLLLFFVWGLGIRRFNLLSSNSLKKLLPIVVLVFLLSFSFQQYIFFHNGLSILDLSINDNRISLILTLLVGMSSSFLLMRLKLKSMFFEKIGSYSYEIYLYHVFGTAGCRIFLNKLGITNLIIHLILGLICGILLPVIIKICIERFPKINLFVFGDKIKTSIKSA